MKLVENFARDWNQNTLPISEIIVPKKIVEANGKKYEVAKAYEVPIWKLGEKNLNNRVYSKGLAEKVIEKNPKTFCLKDHPEDSDGSVDKIVAVAENPHIKENIFYADAYFVDEDFEKKVEKIIERGVGLGVSSSAYGDLDEDGNVMEEGFEIERYFDFVLNPSYQVYLTKESIKESELFSKKDKKEENKNTTTNIIENKKENIIMETKNIQENTSKTKSLEEKNLRLGVRNLFKEADTKDSLQEKLEVYREVIDYCGDSEFGEDYVKQAADKIEQIQQELYELADKGKEVDQLKEDTEKTHKELEEKVSSLEEENTTLKEQYETATQLLDDMKSREAKIRELYEVAIAEKNGMVTAEEYQETAVYLEGKEKELEEALEENRKLKRKVKTYMERAAEGVKEAEKKKDDDEEEDDEEDEDEKKKDNGEKKKESASVVEKEDEDDGYYHFKRDNKQVRNYYEDLVLENPNVEKIKDEILGCGTLFEAQKKYLNLKDLVEDIPNPNSIKRFRMSEADESEKFNKRKTQINIREGWL